ncbi:chitin-binding protein [Nocardiopsis mwathae]|uniref:Chitin-binding protein n=1 Tax=Nocardiopsis mwathae TaxID=1472723 RepID=A0A7X0D6E6_9ACTN|nr:lytic polysaccharide monooxygenase [Nocardiopsis mwathae]MBB6173447.1 chitin-binding protein [Nocardiopsis mwathae]
MTLGRPIRTAALLAGIPLAAALLTAAPAGAHGSMGEPISRVAACYQEGPENPQSDVCKRLVEQNGTQPLYDWHEVNIANADGRHREIIPDGQLCSAGRAKYSALDTPGAWHTTTLPTSGTHTFAYTAAVPHRGYFELYVTKDGWDQSKRPGWGDLEPEPFLRVDRPRVRNGMYHLTGELPQGKSGQHLIYAIWQRTDSPEAFYSCSDVDFGGTGASAAAFEATEEDYGDAAEHAAHGGHGADANAEAGADDGGDAALVSASEGSAADAGASAPDTGHGTHAAHAAAAGPSDGSVVTGLFLTAFAVMAAAAAYLGVRRRRGTTGEHRAR